MVLALLASFLMAVCSLLRSMVADTPYDSFYAISFGDLTWTVVALAFFKCKLKSNFRMSWYQKQEPKQVSNQDIENCDLRSVTNSEAEIWNFSWANLGLVILGGLAEFGNSLMTLMGLSFASEYGINAGIAGVLYPLSTIFVAIIARFAYEEHIQRIQLLGMLVIFAGATVIALFPAEDEEGKKASFE